MKNRSLYSIAEAREMLGGISRNTIYTLLHTGDLPSVVIGCRRFVSESAIAALIAKSTTTQSPAVDPARLRKADQNLRSLPLSTLIRLPGRKGNE